MCDFQEVVPSKHQWNNTQLEMSLFVKHIADKQHFPFFSDATVDIAMPSPCTASSHEISVKAFR